MTTKEEILNIIKNHCLECSDGSSEEVIGCEVLINPSTGQRCALYMLRFGTDPDSVMIVKERTVHVIIPTPSIK